MGLPHFLPKKQAAAFGPGSFDLAAFTIGTKSVNTINVAVQLKDAHGNNIAQPVNCKAYLSDSATGLGITGTPATSAIAIGTNGYILATLVTEVMVDVLTNAAGQFDLNLIQTASPTTEYLVLILPDGNILVSGAITW